MWWSVATSEAPGASRSWAVDSGPHRWWAATPGVGAVTRSPERAWHVRWSSRLLCLKRGVAVLVVVGLLVPMATAPWTV